MSRLPARTTEQMTPKQAEFFEQMADGRPPGEDGRLGGPFDAWGLNPSIGRRIWQLGGAIRFRPSIDRRYIELAILVTAQIWRAQFEWFAHETMAREAGLPEGVIAAVKQGVEPEFDDPGDETAWRLCTTLHRDKRVDDETYAAAVEVHGETGVADRHAWRGRFLQVRQDDVALPDGKPAFREYIVHPGAAMIVPARVFGSTVAITRRMISTPFSSSPWIAAVSPTTGPSVLPWTTISGTDTGVPDTSRVIGSSS